MQVCTNNLSESLLLLGKLSMKITHHRIQGRTLPRYDHRQILFSTDSVTDDQVSLLALVDTKLARGEGWGGGNVLCHAYICSSHV
jgi:hypothetical protein